MIAIMEVLKLNKAATNIDISGKDIDGWYEYGTFGDFTATPKGPAAPAALAEALKVNASVQRVNISDNALDSATKVAVKLCVRPGAEVRL